MGSYHPCGYNLVIPKIILPVGLTRRLPVCETPAYAISRQGRVRPGAEDAGAEYRYLSASALAYLDLGVFSGTRTVDFHLVCAWVCAGTPGMAGGSPVWYGFSRSRRAVARSGTAT